MSGDDLLKIAEMVGILQDSVWTADMSWLEKDCVRDTIGDGVDLYRWMLVTLV